MAYINSIQIPPQESAEALAQAAASALANALGWTSDGTSVWQDEDKSGLKFVFAYSVSSVFPGVGNSLTQQANKPVDYKADTYYVLDYYDTGNTVAVGLRTASGVICLPAARCAGCNEHTRRAVCAGVRGERRGVSTGNWLGNAHRQRLQHEPF